MAKRILRVLFAAALFALILAPAFSYSAEDLLWDGMINVYTDKQSYSDSEPVTGSVSIANAESYPVVAQRIVLHMGSGEYSYPSQFAADNILAEESIGDIWVLPGSTKQVRFSLPAQEAGAYRVDAYSWAMKSKFWGSSSIFYGATSASFRVVGAAPKGNAVIVRTKTAFGAEGQEKLTPGPVGFPVGPGKKIVGKVFIKNESSEAKGGMSLVVSMCDWAIVFCNDPKETSFAVPAVGPGETKQVDVELIAPMIPSAYEISMKLVNGAKTESMYKNRAIVTGGTAKLRKVFISGLANKKYGVSALLAGSPDHFSSPSSALFEDFAVTAEVYDKNAKIEEKSLSYASIAVEEVLDANFALDSAAFDRICLAVRKGGTEFEKECFSVPLAEVQAAYDEANPEVVRVLYSYNESLKELRVSLSKRDMPLNARIRIFASDRTLFQEDVKEGNAFSKTYGVEREDITMTVDDFDAKRQQVFVLNLGLGSKTQLAVDMSPEAQQASKALCTGSVCGEGMACSSAVYDSAEGQCCPALCVAAVSSSGRMEIADVPLIAWAAALMAVLAAAVLFSVSGKIRKMGGRR